MIKNEQERQRIGQRIAELRKAVEWTDELGIHRKGMTQQQLADAADVSRQTINAIESGKFVPSTVLALKLAKIFDKAVEEVFQLEEDD